MIQYAAPFFFEFKINTVSLCCVLDNITTLLKHHKKKLIIDFVMLKRVKI